MSLLGYYKYNQMERRVNLIITSLVMTPIDIILSRSSRWRILFYHMSGRLWTGRNMGLEETFLGGSYWQEIQRHSFLLISKELNLTTFRALDVWVLILNLFTILVKSVKFTSNDTNLSNNYNCFLFIHSSWLWFWTPHSSFLIKVGIFSYFCCLSL